MGHQTLVYGYIETDPSMDEFNRATLSAFSYDEKYPFPNIFSPPVTGYQASMIAFAGAFKTLEEHWEDWQEKFESLLSKLRARTAIVRLESEHDGELLCRAYLNEEGWNGTDPGSYSTPKWKRWSIDKDGSDSDEVIVNL